MGDPVNLLRYILSLQRAITPGSVSVKRGADILTLDTLTLNILAVAPSVGVTGVNAAEDADTP